MAAGAERQQHTPEPDGVRTPSGAAAPTSVGISAEGDLFGSTRSPAAAGSPESGSAPAAAARAGVAAARAAVARAAVGQGRIAATGPLPAHGAGGSVFERPAAEPVIPGQSRLGSSDRLNRPDPAKSGRPAGPGAATTDPVQPGRPNEVASEPAGSGGPGPDRAGRGADGGRPDPASPDHPFAPAGAAPDPSEPASAAAEPGKRSRHARTEVDDPQSPIRTFPADRVQPDEAAGRHHRSG
jgi:hypothetical protein